MMTTEDIARAQQLLADLAQLDAMLAPLPKGASPIVGGRYGIEDRSDLKVYGHAFARVAIDDDLARGFLRAERNRIAADLAKMGVVAP